MTSHLSERPSPADPQTGAGEDGRGTPAPCRRERRLAQPLWVPCAGASQIKDGSACGPEVALLGINPKKPKRYFTRTQAPCVHCNVMCNRDVEAAPVSTGT